MNITGMTKEMNCFGRTLRFCNQKSRDWTHLYEYEGNGSDLHDVGCGVFALVHAIEWMHGIRLDPDEVAEISVAVGGRGDDGTDRPAMLQGMMDNGFAARCGFRYDGDGLLNDHALLWRHMVAGNAALCNLRVGHIVSLLDARMVQGETQVLVLDPYSESMTERIRPIVREVIADSEIISAVRNDLGVLTGWQHQYALYWASDETVRDFNLLHALK